MSNPTSQIKVRNLRTQVIPISHTVDSQVKTYLLKKREIVVMGSTHLSQDLLDKQAAGHLAISDTSDPVTKSIFNDPGTE